MPNVQSKLYFRKQKLKVKSEKLKYYKKLHQRKSNQKSSHYPKRVYCSVKGNSIALYVILKIL